MSGDDLRKVRPGEPLRIRAGTFNAFIDAARDYRQRQQGIAQQPTQAFRDSGTALVRNDSGADRARFEILGVDSVVVSPVDNLDAFKNTVVLTGVTPQQPTHLGRFVVLAEPT